MSKFNTPKSEFIKKKQVSFYLNLQLPVEFKKDWILFRKCCREKGLEFEDVLGGLIIQFNKDTAKFRKD